MVSRDAPDQPATVESNTRDAPQILSSEDAAEFLRVASEVISKMEQTAEKQSEVNKRMNARADYLNEAILPRVEDILDSRAQKEREERLAYEAFAKMRSVTLMGLGLLFLSVATFFVIISVTDIFWFYPAMAMLLLYTIAEERFGLSISVHNY